MVDFAFGLLLFTTSLGLIVVISKLSHVVSVNGAARKAASGGSGFNQVDGMGITDDGHVQSENRVSSATVRNL